MSYIVFLKNAIFIHKTSFSQALKSTLELVVYWKSIRRDIFTCATMRIRPTKTGDPQLYALLKQCEATSKAATAPPKVQ